MSPASIFLIGVFTAALLAVFVYETIHQLRRAGQQRPQGTMIGTGAPGIPDRTPAASHPMRVLVATDGSPCSDAAVQSVAWRPWPPGSEIEVVTVVHSKVPYIPDPALVGPAAYETALEEDRRDAPARARAAERALADLPGLAVTSTVLEGDPAKIIAREADR